MYLNDEKITPEYTTGNSLKEADIAAEKSLAIQPKTLPQKKLWFSAKTELGNITVGVVSAFYLTSESKKINYTISYTRALEEIEETIQWLEDWLKVPLDFLPIKIAQVKSQDVLLAKLSFNKAARKIELNNNKPKIISVLLPRSLLFDHPQPDPQLLSKVTWKWQSIPCQLALSQVTLPTEQYNEIKENSILLIPSAFETQWCAALNIHHRVFLEQPLFPCVIDMHNNALNFHNPNAQNTASKNDSMSSEEVDQDDNTKRLTLFVRDPINISVNYLVGWPREQSAADSVLSFPTVNHHASAPFLLRQRVVVSDNTQPIAAGRVIPVASGYGIVIDKLTEGTE